MVYYALDTETNEIVNVYDLPYKSNDIFAYNEWRRKKRYNCLTCNSTLCIVDPHNRINSNGIEYSVERHFRCNNENCNKEFKSKKRTKGISKNGDSLKKMQEDHNKFIKDWLSHFKTDYLYLEEAIRIPEKKIVLIFSHLLITFEIIRKLKGDNPDYKIIVILTENAKCRSINDEPIYYFNDKKKKEFYEIYLPKKNDIQYCLDKNFEVYLDAEEDHLIKLTCNDKLNDSFDGNLIFINDFSFKTGIFNYQKKPIYRKQFNMLEIFEEAEEKYRKKIKKQMEMKIKENERKEFFMRRNFTRNYRYNNQNYYYDFY